MELIPNDVTRKWMGYFNNRTLLRIRGVCKNWRSQADWVLARHCMLNMRAIPLVKVADVSVWCRQLSIDSSLSVLLPLLSGWWLTTLSLEINTLSSASYRSLSRLTSLTSLTLSQQKGAEMLPTILSGERVRLPQLRKLKICSIYDKHTQRKILETMSPITIFELHASVYSKDTKVENLYWYSDGSQVPKEWIPVLRSYTAKIELQLEKISICHLITALSIWFLPENCSWMAALTSLRELYTYIDYNKFCGPHGAKTYPHSLPLLSTLIKLETCHWDTFIGKVPQLVNLNMYCYDLVEPDRKFYIEQSHLKQLSYTTCCPSTGTAVLQLNCPKLQTLINNGWCTVTNTSQHPIYRHKVVGTGNILPATIIHYAPEKIPMDWASTLVSSLGDHCAKLIIEVRVNVGDNLPPLNLVSFAHLYELIFIANERTILNVHNNPRSLQILAGDIFLENGCPKDLEIISFDRPFSNNISDATADLLRSDLRSDPL